MLARTSSDNHYFLDEPQAAAAGEGPGAGSKLLNSLKAHGLNHVQSLTGLALDPPAWFARLLKHRRLAIAGEVSGHWAAANFYFDECMAKLRSRGPEHPFWQWLAEEWSRWNGSPAQAAEIYRAFIDELFIDLHCGFYNGYGELEDGSGATGRQATHLNYVRGLLELSHASVESWRELLAPALEEQFERGSKAGDLAGAARAAEELSTRFPQEVKYADLFSRAYFELVVKGLSGGKNEAGAQKDAAALAAATRRLDELVEQCPDSLGAFQYASDLHRLQAVRMANAGDVSESMVEIQKSLAYWPGDKAVEEDAQKIAELIRSTQQRAAELETALARNRQLSLSVNGMKLKREAAAGFRPGNEFVNSKERKRITESWERAQLHALWRKVGLPIPTEQWDDQAARLFFAISRARTKMAEQSYSFAAVWGELFAADAELAQLDEDKIRRYLMNEPEPSAVAEPRRAGPRMEVNANGRMGMEPFWAWLWTAQNPWLKVQGAVAVLLLVASLALGGYRDLRLHQREAALKSLEMATAAGDTLNQVIACERYFSTAPPSSDERLAQVKISYRDAMARWFTALPGAPDGKAMRHIRNYAEISARWREGGTL